MCLITKGFSLNFLFFKWGRGKANILFPVQCMLTSICHFRLYCEPIKNLCIFVFNVIYLLIVTQELLYYTFKIYKLVQHVLIILLQRWISFYLFHDTFPFAVKLTIKLSLVNLQVCFCVDRLHQNMLKLSVSKLILRNNDLLITYKWFIFIFFCSERLHQTLIVSNFY